MKLISARLKGLLGVYSGSGVKEIFIDFTKCMHSIIYIIGPNGSGKSTIMSTLHPLPDPPQMYIDGELGEKELYFALDENTMYRILIQYPVYSNRARATTKAFITEINSNGSVELNSNGTIGSFKDIVYSKFNLDPNFISLSYLSVEDRGIVEKKPADRKKFVSALLESIEVYNDIYKTLVKRSSVTKSMINSIVAKIDSIGNEEKLLMDKSTTDTRLIQLTKQKEDIDQQIASAKATISLIDPKNELRTKYDNLFEQYTSLKDSINMLESSCVDSNINSLDDATSEYLEQNNILAGLTNKIVSLSDTLMAEINSREEQSKMLFEKNEKLRSIVDSNNIEDLNRTIIEYRKSIFEYEKTFKSININPDTITKDEYVTALNILQSIRSTIVNIKSYATNKSIICACDSILTGNSLIDDLNSLVEKRNSIEQDLTRYCNERKYYEGLLQRTSILSNRPTQCKINDCIFIKDALEAQEQNPEENIDRLTSLMADYASDIQVINPEIENMDLAVKVYNDINNTIRFINTNKSILVKMPIGEKFVNIPEFVSKIKSGDQFNDIYEAYKYIDYGNMIELYRSKKASLINLESEYKIAQAQKSITDDLKKEILSIEKKVEAINNKISDIQKQISVCENDKSNTENKIRVIDSMISKFRKLDQLKSSKDEVESQLRLISDNIEKISKEVETVNKLTTLRLSVISELEPLNNLKDTLNYSLNKLAEYKAELSEYNKKYTLLELIKKYCSPTKGGIQTIFMQLYMDKTLSMSNQLLGMMFGGQMEILQYIINENEFRIPVKNNISNLIADDVSNCSTSQKSMIAMIMSFVLAYHSSPSYGIVRLDEVDWGLDEANRAMFPNMIFSIMNVLNVSQCFIISHASEFDMNEVDVIKLAPIGDETVKGNLIFHL